MIASGIAVVSLVLTIVALAKSSHQQQGLEAITTETGRTSWPSLVCSGITVRDAAGNALTIGTQGMAAYGITNNERWTFGMLEDGPSLALFDKAGKIRLILGVANTEAKATGDNITSSPGTLTIFKANGDVMFRAP